VCHSNGKLAVRDLGLLFRDVQRIRIAFGIAQSLEDLTERKISLCDMHSTLSIPPKFFGVAASSIDAVASTTPSSRRRCGCGGKINHVKTFPARSRIRRDAAQSRTKRIPPESLDSSQ
jgi:hypothetical protein